MKTRTPFAAIVALVAAAVLAGCSGAPDTATTPTPKSTEPAAEATPDTVETQAPETPDAELTCDTLISDGAVKALTDTGWTAEPRDFAIGDVVLNDGLLCLWADYSVVSDHGQLYGWSPISGDDAAAAQSWLLAQGWIRENGAEGTYFTEDPQYSLSTDENGYGTTYLFGDGWVKLSDTKQGLILIDWAG
ncbi:hypothetical protein [Streptomyces sp. AC495_CC817]|uniref:hypothetical protein n=1 Tax=Streptomyces sp. AC495_CC817 TaxID=2823900 RepID=UPI001C25298A|nr:hypothetical protein [Streptomyces sp. AC495_CC817]